MASRPMPVSEEDPARYATGEILVAVGSQSYLVEKRLGEGGMAEVYAVVQRNVGRRCAIKILREQYAIERGAICERFLHEARMPGKLDEHPNLPRVYDLGELDDACRTPYYVMDRFVGRTLKDEYRAAQRRATRAGRPIWIWLPLNAVLNTITQLCFALERLHERGVVHRDVTPANVFILADADPKQCVQLLDLGIAHLVSDGAPDDIAGTPTYIAPEQLRGEVPGPASDIFSVGVILFQLLTGRLPYPNSKTFPAAIARATEQAPSLDEVRLDLHNRELVELVNRTLSLEPDDRPTATELHAALDTIARTIVAEQEDEVVTADRDAQPREPEPGPTLISRVDLAAPTDPGHVPPDILAEQEADRRFPRIAKTVPLARPHMTTPMAGAPKRPSSPAFSKHQSGPRRIGLLSELHRMARRNPAWAAVLVLLWTVGLGYSAWAFWSYHGRADAQTEAPR